MDNESKKILNFVSKKTKKIKSRNPQIKKLDLEYKEEEQGIYLAKIVSRLNGKELIVKKRDFDLLKTLTKAFSTFEHLVNKRPEKKLRRKKVNLLMEA